MELRAYAAPYNDYIGFIFRCGEMHSTGVMMEKREDGARCEEIFKLNKSEAQKLMDDLWNAGIRPSDGTGSTGQLAATEAHLQDMRRLVFDTPRQP